MRSRHPRLPPNAVQPLLALAPAQFMDGAPALARAEEVVAQLFRQLGPALIEGLLQGALPDPPAEKGARRSVRVGTPDRKSVV